MKRLYAIGIDFGTSNSCVCTAVYARRDDGTIEPQPLKRPEPISIDLRETVPTAVFTGTAEEPPVFGHVAEEKSLYYPELTRTNFKMLLGASGPEGAEAFQLARQFLEFLKLQLTEFVPFEGAPTDVEIATCVGHPVQWSADQRELTRRAAEEAGFPNVSIDDESSAALYDHLCTERFQLPTGRDSRILVVDMGGGTTDFAFVELSADPKVGPVTTPVDPSRLVPPWEGRKTTYGGRDLDELMLRHISGPWGYTRHNREWTFLLRETRRFKEQFSTLLSDGKKGYRASWILDNTTRAVALDRGEFEDLAGKYISHLPQLVGGALALGGLAPEDVDAVVLTGGHSRWYWVERAVQEVLPHCTVANGRLLRHRQPESSVARGLAYRWMVQASGGRPSPRRRAAHSIWIASEEVAAQTFVSTPAQALLVGGSRGTPEDPLLVMDRGQLLPFHTSNPARFTIQKMDFNSDKATLRLKIFSGSNEQSRQELADRIACFDRPFWESMTKKICARLPWSTNYDTDEFDVEVLFAVDENELFRAKVTVTRFYRGKPAQQLVQMLEADAIIGAKTPQLAKT